MCAFLKMKVNYYCLIFIFNIQLIDIYASPLPDVSHLPTSNSNYKLIKFSNSDYVEINKLEDVLNPFLNYFKYETFDPENALINAKREAHPNIPDNNNNQNNVNGYIYETPIIKFDPSFPRDQPYEGSLPLITPSNQNTNLNQRFNTLSSDDNTVNDHKDCTGDHPIINEEQKPLEPVDNIQFDNVTPLNNENIMINSKFGETDESQENGQENKSTIDQDVALKIDLPTDLGESDDKIIENPETNQDQSSSIDSSINVEQQNKKIDVIGDQSIDEKTDDNPLDNVLPTNDNTIIKNEFKQVNNQENGETGDLSFKVNLPTTVDDDKEQTEQQQNEEFHQTNALSSDDNVLDNNHSDQQIDQENPKIPENVEEVEDNLSSGEKNDQLDIAVPSINDQKTDQENVPSNDQEPNFKIDLRTDIQSNQNKEDSQNQAINALSLTDNRNFDQSKSDDSQNSDEGPVDQQNGNDFIGNRFVQELTDEQLNLRGYLPVKKPSNQNIIDDNKFDQPADIGDLHQENKPEGFDFKIDQTPSTDIINDQLISNQNEEIDHSQPLNVNTDNIDEDEKIDESTKEETVEPPNQTINELLRKDESDEQATQNTENVVDLQVDQGNNSENNEKLSFVNTLEANQDLDHQIGKDENQDDNTFSTNLNNIESNSQENEPKNSPEKDYLSPLITMMTSQSNRNSKLLDSLPLNSELESSQGTSDSINVQEQTDEGFNSVENTLPSSTQVPPINIEHQTESDTVLKGIDNTNQDSTDVENNFRINEPTEVVEDVHTNNANKQLSVAPLLPPTSIASFTSSNNHFQGYNYPKPVNPFTLPERNPTNPKKNTNDQDSEKSDESTDDDHEAISDTFFRIGNSNNKQS